MLLAASGEDAKGASMKKKTLACAALVALGSITATAQVPTYTPLPGAAARATLPMDTMIQVTPVEEITSIKMKEGDSYMLQVAADVAQNGVVVIPRGAPVKGTITWRTGKGIGGKSAKFDMTFNSVTVQGRQFALKGKHRQEGKGNTVAALLGSMFVSGRSAIITSGQVLNAFTAEAIPVA
ncbi:hypothetical protein [Sphingomonas montana]|uniref:hypothetical protein n=1 Tax=Sphingomonas montana TaxID=1843236 RepID=UPI00101AE4D7|nr:hypothetical protein [Sphingomonas montana]